MGILEHNIRLSCPVVRHNAPRYCRQMGNYDEEPTARSVKIVEIGASPATSDPDREDVSDKPAAVARPRNPYLYGAWGLVSLMIGLGTLWIIGFSPGTGPERFRTDIVIDSSTGAPIYESTYGAIPAVANLSELAPGLFLVGLSGGLVLLIIQGAIRQMQSDSR